MAINKRQFLQSLAATGVAATICSNPVLAAAGSPSSLDLSKPADLLEAMIKLSGSLDERMTLWWLEGSRYGVVDNIAVPTFGFHIGFFNLYHRLSDTEYLTTQLELTYYTDPNTGELLREWDNPFTGKTNKVRHVRMGPLNRVQTVEGLQPSASEMEYVKSFSTELGPATQYSDSVWIPTTVSAKVQFPGKNSKEIFLNQLTTFEGKKSDIDNPAVVSAPADIIFHNAIIWEPWLKMDGYPGYSMGRAWGKKLMSMDELPDSYMSYAREVNPKQIADPYKLLRRSADRALTKLKKT